jgi:hypothetical protein
MKPRIFLGIFLVISYLIPLLGMAGDKGGNGGGGIFCNGEGVEVYDIAEGRIRYGFSIPKIAGETNSVIRMATDRISSIYPYFGDLLKNEVRVVQQKMELLPVKIERTLDADNIFVPDDLEDCEYRQIANWDESTGRLIVSRNAWGKLNPSQRGVLIIHEAVYSIYRKILPLHLQSPLVDDVRKFVAGIFAEPLVKVPLFDEVYFIGGIDFKVHRPTPFNENVELVGQLYLPNSCLGHKIKLAVSSNQSFILSGSTVERTSLSLKEKNINDLKALFLEWTPSSPLVEPLVLRYNLAIEGCNIEWQGEWECRSSSVCIEAIGKPLKLRFTADEVLH